MKMKIPKKTILTIIIVCLSTLWLRELTLRKGIEEADHYMFPFITSGTLCRTFYRFTWLDTISDFGTVRFSPGWNICYEPVDVLSNGIYVRVPAFKKATGTTYSDITTALNLPLGEERKRAIEKLLNE